MPAFLLSLFTRAKGYAAALIGGALFLAFAYYRAKQDGKNAAELAQARKSADAIKRKKDVDDEVDRMDESHRHSDLSKWMRRDGR